MMVSHQEASGDSSRRCHSISRKNTKRYRGRIAVLQCILERNGRLYTSKKISMWALPTVPLFAGKSRFFLREMSL